MSRWVSQCLLMSLLSASCFPQVVQENLDPHSVWLIILSRIVARSTHAESQFYYKVYFWQELTRLYFRICGRLNSVASEHFWFCKLSGKVHKYKLHQDAFHNVSSCLDDREVFYHRLHKCTSCRQIDLLHLHPQRSLSPEERPEPL